MSGAEVCVVIITLPHGICFLLSSRSFVRLEDRVLYPFFYCQKGHNFQVFLSMQFKCIHTLLWNLSAVKAACMVTLCRSDGETDECLQTWEQLDKGCLLRGGGMRWFSLRSGFSAGSTPGLLNGNMINFNTLTINTWRFSTKGGSVNVWEWALICGDLHIIIV